MSSRSATIGGEDESLMADARADSQDESSNSQSVQVKIKYDRDFLLQIGKQNELINEFNVEAAGFPDLVRNGNLKHPLKPRGLGREMPLNKGPLMSHLNMQHMRSMSGMGMGNWGQGGPLIMIPHRAQPKVQLTRTREEVKLHKAENAWKPGALKRAPQAGQATDEEAIAIESFVTKTRGILNKLTPNNFDELVSKFMELPLEENDERISSVLSVVFEKAIDEPSYSPAYAKMVHTVSKTSQQNSKKFRKENLDQCQKLFQKSSADEADIKEVEQQLAELEKTRDQLKNVLEEKRYMNRRRGLGNARFIGELYKLQMLTPKILVDYVHLLLNAPDEDKLECLCKLLSTVGQKLDFQLKSMEDSANRRENPKFVPEPKWMDKIFQQLKELSNDSKLSSRIRFAILDVVELWQNDWKPRRETKDPRTEGEVKIGALRQEMEEKIQINRDKYGGDRERDRRSTGKSRLPSSQQQKKSERTTKPVSKTSRFQTGVVNKVETLDIGMSVFGPPSGSALGLGWQVNQSSPQDSSSIHKRSTNLPPILKNRFQNISTDDNRSSNT